MSTYVLLLAGIFIWFYLLPFMHERHFKINGLVLFPMAFIVLLFRSLQKYFILTQASFLLVIMGLIFGALLGAVMRRNAIVDVKDETKLITVSGSVYVLIAFGLIALMHYLMHYWQTASPYILKDYAALLIFNLATVTGIPLGQTFCLLSKYKKSLLKKDFA